MTGRVLSIANNLREQIETFLAGCSVAGVVEIDQYRVVGSAGQGLPRQYRGAHYIDLVALRL